MLCYSINDIYSNLLLFLSNHKYIVDKNDNRCRLWLLIFNSNKHKEIYNQEKINEGNNAIKNFFEDM